MEKYITDERTGLRYELIGEIYYLAGDDEQDVEQEPIGIWGQRHLCYIRERKYALYSELVISGKLNSYLVDINRQAEDMFFQLMQEMAEREGVSEQLKAQNQFEWVRRMNSIRVQVIDNIINELLI